MHGTESALAEDRSGAGSGFEPESVLPAQLLTSAHGARTHPQKRLMLAVLEDAVACVKRGVVTNARRAKHDFEEARAWIASDDTTWPYSFLNIAHVLGLDPGYLRQGLRKLAGRAAGQAAGGEVVPFRFAFRPIGRSSTRTVAPRRGRGA
jgi:hypothetical protein